MKILHVTHSLDNGGAEKFLVELSNELYKTPIIRVCCLSPITDAMHFRKEIETKIELISFNGHKKYSYTVLAKLYRQILNFKPEVVHIHLQNSFYYVFILLFFRKTRFIHTIAKRDGRKVSLLEVKPL